LILQQCHFLFIDNYIMDAEVRNMNFKAQHVPGTQQIREKMGHCLFGMRVQYGDGLFITISPSDRHSGLALRLLRYRRNDPALERHEDWKKWPQLYGPDSPKLEDVMVDLPDYEFRRLVLVQQPRAVVDAFQISVRCVLSRLLGMRMCPRCPACNADRSRTPCQDEFGSNMEPLGGVFGGVEAIGGAVEHQRVGPPHLHALASVVSIFQHSTVAEIAERIRENLLDVEAIKQFQSWVCQEEHFNLTKHEADMVQLEAEWPAYSDPKHEALHRRPLHLTQDDAPCIGTKAVQNHWLRCPAEKRRAACSVLQLAGVQKKLEQAAQLAGFHTEPEQSAFLTGRIAEYAEATDFLKVVY
jgi:hypothetical protein